MTKNGKLKQVSFRGETKFFNYNKLKMFVYGTKFAVIYNKI